MWPTAITCVLNFSVLGILPRLGLITQARQALHRLAKLKCKDPCFGKLSTLDIWVGWQTDGSSDLPLCAALGRPGKKRIRVKHGTGRVLCGCVNQHAESPLLQRVCVLHQSIFHMFFSARGHGTFALEKPLSQGCQG